LNDGRIGEEVTQETLEELVDAGVISSLLTSRDFAFLQRFGILRPELNYEDGAIQLENGNSIPADLANEDARDEIGRCCLGTTLKGGHFAHACFFLGPQKFYDTLRQMDAVERQQICMTGISYVNELYGQEELKRLQRKAARFVNTGLFVTLAGAVTSDGLEDGRVLSGVGGQYNFVAMAHALDDGHSIIMIRSTKHEAGKLRSNVRWSYGHVTIPRHLRDIVVTEYGVADLRGRDDQEVIKALLEIADSRFQDELLKEAKSAGKISKNYHIPDYASDNRPERLEKVLARYRERGLFQEFPFGTDLTADELVLRKALRVLKQTVQWRKFPVPRLIAIRKTVAVPDNARPYLERMALARPRTIKERLLQRTLVYGLASVDAI